MKRLILSVSLLLASVGSCAAAGLNAAQADHVLGHVRDSIRAAKSTGCVAVVDASGVLIAFQRFDKAPPGCVEASIGKARTSALYHAPSLKFMQRLQQGETTVLAIPQAVPLGGGFPLTLHGEVVGAVGVSTPEQELDNQASESAANALN
ncbi:GlcG/HbpS family heme-binding protein [Erwinia sp.]|uniref:GlcG/HbpS family heme-binding protein n=1 Tax=Erwinia citreus TaxID=558 RepID=UPI003C78A9BF